MAQIEKDGIYKNDAQFPDYIQFRKGTEVGDVKWTYDAPFPDAVDPRTGQPVKDETAAKADAAPANKAAAAPSTKADKG